jgi:hypothetical protein
VSWLLTIFALWADSVTVTTGEYELLCVLACSGATTAAVLIAIVWRRLPLLRRILMTGFVVVDSWVLLSAGLCRLAGWSW